MPHHHLITRRPATAAVAHTLSWFWLNVVFALIVVVLTSLDLVALEAYVAGGPDNLNLISELAQPID
jgi:hypothetical protein